MTGSHNPHNPHNESLTVHGICDGCGWFRRNLREAHLAHGDLHDWRLVCLRCFTLLAAEADEPIDTDVCPHCSRPVVEERDHADGCDRGRAQRAVLASMTGPATGGAL
jgi:hypothetical protein